MKTNLSIYTMKTETLPKIEWIKVSELTNLENNPRYIKDDRFQKLCDGLTQSPELFLMRPCLVNEREGKLVVYAGNMRLKAAKTLKWKEVPCIVSELPIEKEKELTIRDNVELGNFDWDIIANEFADLNLADFGLDVPNFDLTDYSEKNKEVDIDSLETELTISLKYTQDDYDFVIEKLSKLGGSKEKIIFNLIQNA